MQKSQFTNLVSDSMERLPRNFQRTMEQPAKCYCSFTPWTRELHRIAEISSMADSNMEREMALENSFLEFLAVFIESGKRGESTTPQLRKADRDKLELVRQWLDEHFAEKTSLHALASMAGLNVFALKKGFRDQYSVSVMQYQLSRRMASAMILMHKRGLKVGEIALMVGYENESAFIRAFRRWHGFTPRLMI